MKVTAYVSHEDSSRHDTGWSHADHQGRLPAVTRAVYRDMVALYEPLLQVEGVPATEQQLLRVHTRRYVDDVRRTAIAAAAEGRPLELGGEQGASCFPPERPAFVSFQLRRRPITAEEAVGCPARSPQRRPPRRGEVPPRRVVARLAPNPATLDADRPKCSVARGRLVGAAQQTRLT